MSGDARSADDVSYEIGMCYIPIIGSPATNPAEDQVFAALYTHRTQIADAATRFNVSRVAIAGAIAWEMLENVRSGGFRSIGWGKVHTFSTKPWDDPIAKEVEDRGYLPQQTFEERKRILATPEGAIVYIGAIMGAIADAAETRHGGSIRMKPEILANVFQSMDLQDWEKHLDRKPKDSDFSGGNPMDVWLVANRDFLEQAVGKDQ
jgi:hypothetical protein